jgi:hypothetical protein
VRRKPLVWARCNLFAKSELSPCRMAWQPSSNDICKLKSCRILISAGFNPGISRPFLIRRMRRMGSISAPTFSSKPRMNSRRDCKSGRINGEVNERGRVSEYFNKSSQRSSSFWSLAKSIAYGGLYEDMTVDAARIHTLFTSPKRSIIRCNAFLLSPIRPSRNTISGTRSRSVQILYA